MTPLRNDKQQEQNAYTDEKSKQPGRVVSRDATTNGSRLQDVDEHIEAHQAERFEHVVHRRASRCHT